MKGYFRKGWKWYITVVFIMGLAVANSDRETVMFADSGAGLSDNGNTGKQAGFVLMAESEGVYEDEVTDSEAEGETAGKGTVLVDEGGSTVLADEDRGTVSLEGGETSYGDEIISEDETDNPVENEDSGYRLEYKCGELELTGVGITIMEEDTELLPSEQGTYELKPDTVYAYTVWGTGITGKSGTFDMSSAIDNKIIIEIELITPNLELQTKDLTGDGEDFGKEVSVEILNRDELYDGVTWIWKCVKAHDDLQITPNEKGDAATVKLSGAAGDYHIFCEYGDYKSNEIMVTVPQAKLVIKNTDKLPKAEKDYDGLRTITFETTVDEDGAVAVQGGNDETIYTGDTLKITGELDSADAGAYKEITIKEIETVTSSMNITYDISSLLENPRIEAVDFCYKINQAKIEMPENQKIYLYYRRNIIDRDKTKKNIKLPSGYDGENGESIRQTLLDALGQVIITDRDKCTFSNLTAEESRPEGTNYFVDSNNIKFLFDSNEFTYEWLSEIMGALDISQIAVMQGSHDLFKESEKSDEIKCDETAICTKLLDTETRDSYYSAYDKVTYKKTDAKMRDFEKYDIYSDYKKAGTEEQLKVELDSDGEAYYEMFFVRENVPSTVAAILHFIGEDAWDETIEKTEQITDSKGHHYTVINILFDDTAGIVEFESGIGGVLFDNGKNPDICAGKKWKGENETLFFTIKNSGFAVGSIWYMPYKTDGGSLSDMEISFETNRETGEPVDGNWKSLIVNGKNQYSVPLPADEGDYVVFVMVNNERGKSAVYVSGGIIIDRTSPVVDVKFRETESMLEIKNVSTNRENPTYKAAVVTADFKITESHLEDVEVTITAKDGKGDRIEEALDNGEIEKLKGALSKQKEGTFTFAADANYTVKITATDAGGLTNDGTVYYFTVDTTAPETGLVQAEGIYRNIKNNADKKQGKIDMAAGHFQEAWNQLLPDIEYRLFSQEAVTVTLEGNDRISPVTIYYYIAESQMTFGQLDEMADSKWKRYSPDKGIQTDINRKIIIYEKVADQAGNRSYFCSDGMITDNTKPEIQVSYAKEQNKNGFYNDNITFTVFVKDDMDSGEYGCSGLKLISCRIEKGEEITKGKILYEGKANEMITEKEFTEVIEAGSNNSNDITLYITAVDRAGNRCDYKKEIKLDNAAPEITVTYDNNDAVGKYYSKPRTATIAVRERNLNTKDVVLSVNSTGDSAVEVEKWQQSENAGYSDDAVYSCNVTFLKDDDYIFEVSCTDKAGNQSRKNYRETFTIDTTAPVVEVRYDGETPPENAYYNESITATIAITEHNFDERKVKIETDGVPDAYETAKPVISNFTDDGDVHRATVSYSGDGKYGLAVSYADEAGNTAKSYSGNSFTLDRTKPEITITNIEDKSANKGDVKPVVTCTDINYDKNLVSFSVAGSNSGEVNLETVGYKVSGVEKGQQFVMDFPKTEEMDDIYTLTVKVQDRAGNAEERSIEFSVNRYGSVYTLGKETEEWLKSGECAYIQEGKPIVIIETNVDEIASQNISYHIGSIGGSYVDIKEMEDCSLEEREQGLYYKVSSLDSGQNWCQRRYEINPENFKAEGNYTVQIDSADIAGNSTSNISNWHSDGKLPILFAVDKTAPSAAVSGAENGGIYNEAEHTVFIDVQDNLALDKVAVYVNDEEYGTYTAEEITALEGGLIPVRIGQSLSMQSIRVMAKDRAGNVLGGTGKDGGYDREFEPVNILVTTNPVVRFFHTAWALILGGLMIAAAGTAVMVYRKRKIEYTIRKD